jgi:DNA-binding MltR family transcriptional regulator
MARKVISFEELSKTINTNFSAALGGQSDLACALIATAFVENALLGLLGKFFIEGSTTVETLLKPGNALGDLSKCADISYVLGLINKPMMQNIKEIGNIRNTFAHSHEFINFEATELDDSFAKLTLPLVITPDGKIQQSPGWGTSRRDKFSYITLMLLSSIRFQTLQTKHQVPTNLSGVWPESNKPKKKMS